MAQVTKSIFPTMLHTFLSSLSSSSVYTRTFLRLVFLYFTLGSHVTFGKIALLSRPSMDRGHETDIVLTIGPIHSREWNVISLFSSPSSSSSRPMIVLIVSLFYISLYFHASFLFFFRTRILIFSRVEGKNTGFIRIEMILFTYPSQINRKNRIGKV